MASQDDGPYRFTVVLINGHANCRKIKRWKEAYREFDKAIRDPLTHYCGVWELTEDTLHAGLKEEWHAKSNLH